MKRLVLLLLVVCLAACQAQESVEHRVRHPRLDLLEEQVRRTLENALGRWRDQLATSDLPGDEARAYAQLGQVYLAHHFDEAAADALSFATQRVRNPHWYFYYGTALDRSFRHEEAEQALSASLALHDHPEVRFARAKVRSRVGNIAGALDDLKALKAISRMTGDSGDDDVDSGDQEQTDAVPLQAAWFALEARLLAHQRQYPKAMESLMRALELEPEATSLHGPMAQLQLRLGSAASAGRHRRLAGDGLPGSEQPLMDSLSSLARGSRYYLDRGRELMAARNFEEAVADFAIAADIAPSSHDAVLAYARALEVVGQVDLAEQQYLDALRLNPESEVAHYFLGSLYERREQDEQALTHYAAAIEADADYLPPRLSLAHALFGIRRFEEALTHYAYYADSRENDLEVRYYAGLAALAMGDCEAGTEWFRQAINVNSHSRAAQEGVARSFAVCSSDPSELSRAQDIGERHEEERPDASAAETLAMVYAALNDFESAARLQNLAIRRSNDERQNGQRDRLTQYESELRAQVAWLPDSPVFDPPRLSMRVYQ